MHVRDGGVGADEFLCSERAARWEAVFRRFAEKVARGAGNPAAAWPIPSDRRAIHALIVAERRVERLGSCSVEEWRHRFSEGGIP